MEEKQITVTSPLLPSLDELNVYLKDIWQRKWITNNGHYHRELEKALCESFLQSFCRLFFAEDPRERDCVRVQIHRIYAHFPAKRGAIRGILQNVLREFCAENRGLEGVQDLLRFYSAIIKGIALPIHPEHLAFLRHSLLPLLKKTRIECCFRGIDDCITEFVKKDASLAVPVGSAACCHSDHPDAAEILAARQHEQGDRLPHAAAVRRVARSVERPAPCRADHRAEALRMLRGRSFSGRRGAADRAKIAEKSLKLWDNERFAENMKSVADLSLFRKTLKDSEEHYWCIEVHPDFAHVLGICACFVCWKGGAICSRERRSGELGPPGSFRFGIDSQKSARFEER